MSLYKLHKKYATHSINKYLLIQILLTDIFIYYYLYTIIYFELIL